MKKNTRKRLKSIQTGLGLKADGLLGNITLTEIEKQLDTLSQVRDLLVDKKSMALQLPKSGVQKIIDFEIGSVSYYNAKLKAPSWPGGDSGVTIGIGYDLGYQSIDGFQQDWKSYLDERDIHLLVEACGVKGELAKKNLPELSHINIDYDSAYEVFMKTSLPAYAKKTKKAFPRVENLDPDAQLALVSLVYNRGVSMKGDSRIEMRIIRDLIASKNYEGIAFQIESMKRLWENKGLDGLIKRREIEAVWVRKKGLAFQDAEILTV